MHPEFLGINIGKTLLWKINQKLWNVAFVLKVVNVQSD